ncbi:MAG: hypothetical protein ACXQTP_05115 [Candidatus Methanofastidiosia archaeon]
MIAIKLKYAHEKITIENKIITTLDKFVLDFSELLENHVDYVIVSGYITILFGRARGTEDIDTIIRYMDKPLFNSFYQCLRKNGYYFLNPENVNGLYEMLEEGTRIRIAKEDTIIPNIELKFVKDDFERYSIDNRLKIMMGKKHLFVSPIELQIPYKIYLGSDKDIEDAIYLWDIFKEKIDKHLLRKFIKELNVNGENYGIKV